MRFALDTNAVIAALNGIESVVGRLSRVPASDVGVPIVVLAELLYGAYRSRRREENSRKVESLQRRVSTLALCLPVADRYGSIRAKLAREGMVKTDFDLIIASTAIMANVILVTNDHALLHGTIPDLQAENWLTTDRA